MALARSLLLMLAISAPGIGWASTPVPRLAASAPKRGVRERASALRETARGAMAVKWQGAKEFLTSPKRLARTATTNGLGVAAGVLIQSLTHNYFAAAVSSYAVTHGAEWAADFIAPSTADPGNRKSWQRHVIELTAGSTIAGATAAFGLPLAKKIIEKGAERAVAAPVVAALARTFGAQRLAQSMASGMVSVATAGTEAAAKDFDKRAETKLEALAPR
jgi:hypothetical protein